MSDYPTISEESLPKAAVGNLMDFVDSRLGDSPLNVEITIDDNTNKILIFHNKPFTTRINCFEYNMKSSELFFVMQGGEKRNMGAPLSKIFTPYLHNAHHILTIEMNDETGDANRGEYIPLLLLQN